MKILIIPSWYPPNGGHFFQELSESIHQQGHSVDVLVNENISIKKLNLKKAFCNNKLSHENGLKVYRNYFYNIPKSDIINYKLWIKKYFKKYKNYAKQNGHPDIIHVHSTIWGGAVAALINKNFSIPYIITEHRSRFVYNTNEAKRLFKPQYIPDIKEALLHASRITTVTPALNAKLIDIEKSVKNKIISIPNTIDTKLFKPKDNKNNTFTWFSLGNLEHVKGMDILLKAFSEVNKKYPDANLNIGGHGSQYNNLQELSEKYNLEKKVSFLGKLAKEEVANQMQNADSFVLATRFEAFGVVFIEALACGTPIIGTKVGGPEYIIDKKNGILVEPENSEALSTAMITLMENYSQYNKKEISRTAANKYDKNIVAKKYCSLFEEVLNESNN